MSEMLNTVTTAVKLVVAGVGGIGPKATAVNFLKDDFGVREWAWLPNAIAASVRKGSVVTAEFATHASKTETTYIKDGKTLELKVPKRQVFLGGVITVDAPESKPLPEATYVVTEAARVYASRVDAKQVASAATSEASSENDAF